MLKLQTNLLLHFYYLLTFIVQLLTHFLFHVTGHVFQLFVSSELAWSAPSALSGSSFQDSTIWR